MDNNVIYLDCWFNILFVVSVILLVGILLWDKYLKNIWPDIKPIMCSIALILYHISRYVALGVLLYLVVPLITEKTGYMIFISIFSIGAVAIYAVIVEERCSVFGLIDAFFHGINIVMMFAMFFVISDAPNFWILTSVCFILFLYFGVGIVVRCMSSDDD